MQAADVMTTEVVSVTLDTTVQAIARRLLERRISAVPVIDADGSLVGIVSEGDLTRRVESGTERRPSRWLEILASPEEQAREYVKSHGRLARDVMTREVVTVKEDTPLEAVATLLEMHRIKRAPVLRSGKVVGIVSRADLLHGLVAAKRAPAPSVDDRNLRERVIEAAKASGSDLLFVSVVVAGTVVELWGGVPSQAQKAAIRIAAESVAGVSAVENHLWVYPEHFRAMFGSQ